MQHLDEINNLLTTTTIYKGSSIIICVNIPRFHPTIYEKVIIEPLPRHNHSVKLEYGTVFMNPSSILAITSQCREANKVTICERRQLVDISDSLCEAKILRSQQGQCPLLEHPPSVETRIIDPGTLLVLTVHQDVIINGTCGLKPKTLTGIHLITFHNCSLYVKNELYENYEFRFEHPSILPMQLANIKTLHIERHVNLSQLHELHLKNREHLEIMDFKYQLGFASLSTVITLMFVLIAIGIFKYRHFLKLRNCSGRAILKGGLVKRDYSPETSTAESTVNTESTRSTKGAPSALSQTEASSCTTGGTTDNFTNGGPSLLGARLAVLGHKAGQLGL